MYGLRMLLRGKHPIHGLPFPGPVPNRLREEWEAMPRRDRSRRLRKVFQRDLAILATGQAGLCVERVPLAARKVLWLYNWTTLGDSIMDLAARFSVPGQIQLDLCITPALAALYAADARFANVYTRVDDCPQDFDFVLLHELSTHSLRDKRRRFRRVPFAPMLNYIIGEQFDRAAFADARLRHLFGQPGAAAPTPALHLGASPARPANRFDIALALGARDPRRRFPHWNAALLAILRLWPAGRPVPRFRLLGSDNAADDLASLSHGLLAGYAENLVGRTSLIDAAHVVRDCDAFLGTDGGLMHVATALGKPGLALFAGIEPGLRLPAGASLRSLFAQRAMADHSAAAIAEAFVAACAAVLPATPLRRE